MASRRYARTPKSLKSGPRGSRRSQRAQERAMRAASLHFMMHRARWRDFRDPERRRLEAEYSLRASEERPEDPTPSQFESMLFGGDIIRLGEEVSPEGE